mmetsp:Transcript_24902/g.31352  ORF Transcript_24902/g.31352 Transcript_24902/m.31352 type:complete len:162 (-) Transcript_24902:74-559(-)|eukprot:CAMPEP_0203668862 /NCGR_PEP_ID=MMETSP0090-20130426/5387_1 /ASSEMBLY_ACC=CAM_ASM_001088 /TAXON_ID=426623 /ORGANISM="Chaetoceros affinis, Strain CCMP159" /LENGTH=161 /DNA_ID=CAMNT_0050533415 /DNA_START=154 /DNA_END=639 /DNA_ORIENTATION=-
MSAALFNTLKKVPVPLFGSAATAAAFGARKAASIPRFAPWALPLGAGALWFVWPAVDEEWKATTFGSSAPAPEEKKVELSPEAIEKVEKAYVVEEKELTAEEKAVVKAVAGGDFSLLEKEWDAFQVKASVPGDGDDDDDDDEDDDEEDEEEEEEEDEEDDE